MTMAINDFAQILAKNGFSMTKPRQEVFSTLQASEPQTMAELIKRTPGVDRASIYRTIELFEKLGIVQRLQMGWKYKLELSDEFSTHHHHATCVNCGKITNLPENEVLEQQIQVLALTNNFVPRDHQLEIHGLCPSCQAQ